MNVTRCKLTVSVVLVLFLVRTRTTHINSVLLELKLEQHKLKT